MTAQKSIFIALDGSDNGTVPKGARLALGGLIEHDGSGSPISPKLGVLEDTFTPVVAGTAGMTYDIRAAVFVSNPTGAAANGPTVGANDATVNVATTPAPGSNARYDVIWVRQHVVAADGGADSDNILEFGVTQGAVAASPSIPSIPTGALALANVLVTSGTTATNTLTFARAHNWVKTRGGIGLRQRLVYTASGTFTKDDYPWARFARITCVGGGGGGGGAGTAAAGPAPSGGAGGGAGGTAEKFIDLASLPSSVSVTRGAGGAGGAGGTGATGGTSGFGSVCSADGGVGGAAASGNAAGVFPQGGAGGSATGGDINTSGSNGGDMAVMVISGGVRAVGGEGGASRMSGSTGTAVAAGPSTPGLTGKVYGGGGQGSVQTTAGQSGVGGDGANGIVIVELYG